MAKRSVLDSVGDFFSSMANDFAIGTGMKDDPGRNSSGAVIGPFSETSYEARTRETRKTVREEGGQTGPRQE